MLNEEQRATVCRAMNCVVEHTESVWGVDKQLQIELDILHSTARRVITRMRALDLDERARRDVDND